LLRREGIYDSMLSAWRKALRMQGEAGMKGQRRGRPQTRNEREAKLKTLERENARLRSDLDRAQAVIELQKNYGGKIDMTGITAEASLNAKGPFACDNGPTHAPTCPDNRESIAAHN
jgi:hypothetical protein